MDEFPSKFKKEFSLVSFVSGCDSNKPLVEIDQKWIIDSGYASHMIGIRDVFLDNLEIGPDRLI